MGESSFQQLAENGALLLALVFLFDVAALRWRIGRLSLRQAPIGLIIGAVGIGVMLIPWQFTPGIVFDTRSVLLSISGLFFGAVPTLVAMAITAAFRLFQGGGGAWTGVSVILVTGTLGIAWRHYRRHPLVEISWIELFLFGVATHLVMLALMFTLPWATALRALAAISLPVLVIYPLATALLGALMVNRLRREQTVAAMRESEARSREISSAITDIAYSCSQQPNGDYDITWMTGATARITGYTIDEMKTFGCWGRLVLEEDQANFEQHVSGLAPGATGECELRLRRRDGDVVWVASYARCVAAPDGSGQPHLQLYGALADITERKRAQEALRESEELYRSLFENMLNGFAYCRMLFENGKPQDFIYLVVNDAFETLTGLKNVAGRRVTEVIPGIRETDQQLFEIYGRVAMTGQPERFEIFVEALQMWFWVSVYSPAHEHFVAVFDVITERKQQEAQILAAQVELSRLLAAADQSRRALLSVVEDQKRAEEAIRTLNAALEQRVRDRTAQLEAANQELEAFAYSVSHDLRAPLRALDGFSAALLSHYAGQLDEQGRHYLDRIQQASQRMGQLINDLLDLSRVTRAEFTRQRVDLSALAHEIVAELQGRDPQRQAEFSIAEQLEVQGDPRLLRVVLQNLLENAWKFTGPRPQARIEVGQMTIEDFGLQIADWKPHLSQSEISNPKSAIYFVRDNGVGFDMVYAAKLFAPFQRLHGVQEFPGTGIGLATVQRILTRHGGRIWTEAAVDRGATFYFTLGGI